MHYSNPFGSCPPQQTVDMLLGKSYHVVKTVYLHLKSITVISEYIEELIKVAEVADTIIILKELADKLEPILDISNEIINISNNIEAINTVAELLKSIPNIPETVEKILETGEYVKDFAEGTPRIVESIGDIYNSKTDGYFWVKNFNDPEHPEYGNLTIPLWNRSVKATGSTKYRILEDRFADIANVADFGAKGDGISNDTSALEAAFSSGNKAFYLKGSFLINHLSIPDDVVLFGAPEFVDAGTQQADQYVLELGARVKAEHISLKMVNNDIYRWGISVGENNRINDIRVYADSYINSEAVHLNGNGIYIGNINIEKVHRGFTVGAYQKVDRTTGKLANGDYFFSNCVVGSYCLRDSIQGIRIGRASKCTIGPGSVYAPPDSFSRTPSNGYNGIYITASNFIEIGDVRLERILEHGVRLGGDDVGISDDWQITHDISFGSVVSHRQGGSAVKINTTSSQPCYNISIGRIESIDAGQRGRESTRRINSLRISHCTGFYCGAVISRTTDPNTISMNSESGTWQPETDTVEINNASNVEIGSISADFIGRSVVSFNEENDADSASDYSSFVCKDIRIDGIFYKENKDLDIGWYAIRIINTGMSISDLSIKDIEVEGNSLVRYVTASDNAKLNNVFLSIFDAEGKSSAIDQTFSLQSTAKGTGQNIIRRKAEFDKSNAVASATLLVDGISDSTNSGEEYGLGGAAIVLTRYSGFRPSGAIVSYQRGTGGNAGLAVLVSSGKTSSNVVTPIWFYVAGQSSPFVDNTISLGNPTKRVTEVFAGTATINTSDSREKSSISPISNNLLEAVGNIPIHTFKFTEAVEKKGENAARLHIGVTAQEVKQAFEEQGLDATNYGLFCHDEWEDEYANVDVIDEPAIVNDEGVVIKPAVKHKENKKIQSAGDRYGIRYVELLILECAYLRNELSKIKTVLANKGINLGD